MTNRVGDRGSRYAAGIVPALVVGLLMLALSANSASASRRAGCSGHRSQAQDVPPIGVRVETIASNYSVRIHGQDYGPRGPLGAEVLVVNRCTLQVQHFHYSYRGSDLPAIQHKLFVDLKVNSGSLVILQYPVGMSASHEEAKFFNKEILARLGGTPVSIGQTERSFSVIGSPGWQEGSAFSNFGVSSPGPTGQGDLVGYLQRNPAGQAVSFVFGQYSSFNTRADSSANSITMRFAGRSWPFSLPSGQSGFAALVLNRGNLEARASEAFATNTGAPANDQDNQKRLGAFLQSHASRSDLVVIQSIGSPRPNTPGWNELAAGIAKDGGNPDLVNALKGGYALVAAPGVASGAVESVNDPTTREDGSITGVLAPDHAAGFAPLLSDPTGHPTLNDLLQLAYRKPSTWPARDTPELRAAIRYISEQLHLAGDDPRFDYTDLLIRFDSAPYYGRLDHMSYPGSAKFTEQDFARVKSELLKEFLWVSKVRGYTDQVRHVMDESIIVNQSELAALARRIRDLSGAGDGKASLNAFQIYAELFGLAKALAPDPAAASAAGAVSTAFKIAGALVKENGTDVLGTFTTTTNDMAHQLTDRYVAGLSSLDLMLSILETDHDKLEIAGTSIIEHKPGWVWDNTTRAATLRAITIAAKRLINETLLPIVYVTYRLPSEFQHAPSCRVLAGEPSSAWISHIHGFSGSPGNIHANTQAWAVGTRQEDDRSGRMKANAQLFDPLFQPFSPDGTDQLALSQVVFVTQVMRAEDLRKRYCHSL